LDPAAQQPRRSGLLMGPPRMLIGYPHSGFSFQGFDGLRPGSQMAAPMEAKCFADYDELARVGGWSHGSDCCPLSFPLMSVFGPARFLLRGFSYRLACKPAVFDMSPQSLTQVSADSDPDVVSPRKSGRQLSVIWASRLHFSSQRLQPRQLRQRRPRPGPPNTYDRPAGRSGAPFV
jgi:hypothetical protein